MLEQHEKKADDWTEAIALTSKTDELGATDTAVNPLLHFKWKDGEATGRYVSGTFIVYKGSRIRSGSTASCPSGALRLREKYADKIVDGVLTDNILLPSPSSAAAFIGGASLNGWVVWLTEAGQTLKEYSGT